MNLSFGSFKFDAKRLPPPLEITIERPESPERPVRIEVQLTTRVAVYRWATRLGVLAATTEPFPLRTGTEAVYEGSVTWVRDLQAVYEADGFVMRVYFRGGATHFEKSWGAQ